MNETLTFAGINSGAYGVYIAGDGVYNAPERSVEMITVPGRSGNLAIDGGRFENIEITYPAFMFRTSQPAFASGISDFRNAMLSKIGYQRLTDDYNPDEFRLAVYKSGLDVDPKIYNRAGEFNLTFDCKPQRFLISGETAVTFSAAGSIVNPTNFPAAPLLEITGTGVVGIGDYSFTLTGVSGQTIVIDCEVMESWEVIAGANVNRNDLVQFAGNEFPKLTPGTNGVSLGDGITQIEIVPRWWRL